MKRVVLLLASPRKNGNSDILCHQFIKGAEDAGHDSKAGLKLVRDELTDIFQNLGNEIKGIIWGENVWQKGEVKTTKAMEEAYHAGLNI
jgi:hypothetical protein